MAVDDKTLLKERVQQFVHQQNPPEGSWPIRAVCDEGNLYLSFTALILQPVLQVLEKPLMGHLTILKIIGLDIEVSKNLLRKSEMQGLQK